ncbi:MAG: hypothetical protein QF404_08660 [Planctomycetota bacterium]|nr:hypothetical protein [Planctomycetota bacterium]
MPKSPAGARLHSPRYPSLTATSEMKRGGYAAHSMAAVRRSRRIPSPPRARSARLTFQRGPLTIKMEKYQAPK